MRLSRGLQQSHPVDMSATQTCLAGCDCFHGLSISRLCCQQVATILIRYEFHRTFAIHVEVKVAIAAGLTRLFPWRALRDTGIAKVSGWRIDCLGSPTWQATSSCMLTRSTSDGSHSIAGHAARSFGLSKLPRSASLLASIARYPPGGKTLTPDCVRCYWVCSVPAWAVAYARTDTQMALLKGFCSGDHGKVDMHSIIL